MSENALRFNSGKIPIADYIEWNALIAFAVVCMKNSEKYGGKYPDGNYRKGAPLSEYLNSGMRHFALLMSGEDIDPTDQVPHVFKIHWNASRAVEVYMTRPDLNDLPQNGVLDFAKFAKYLEKEENKKDVP